MADAERLDPSLLTAGQRNEEAELDQFRLGEVRVQGRPQLFVGEIRIPDDGARVAQRGLLPLGEPI